MRRPAPRPVLFCSCAFLFALATLAGNPTVTAEPERGASKPSALRLRSAVIPAEGSLPAVPANLAAPPIERGGTALVQFRAGSSPAERRAAVESVGGTYGPYVPDHGAMVLLPAGAADGLRARAEVARVVAYEPFWKLAPGAAGPGPARELIVALHPWADVETTVRGIEAAGATVLDRPSAILSAPATRVRVPDGAVAESLALLPGVRWIEAATEQYLMNDRTRWIVQSNQPGVFSIYDHGIRGTGQILAAMDSGLDKKHCCFDTGRRIDSYAAFGGGDRDDGCDLGHGTHVFGTAGCSEPAGVYNGVAPEIHFIVQDIQGSGLMCNGGMVSPPSDLRDPFQSAYDGGARVHTNSWGGGRNSYDVSSQQIDDFMWTHQDFLILFAAGNSGGGANAGTVSNQASAKNSVTVGGTISYPSQESLYRSSSKGPTAGGRRKPDVTAPATGSPEVTSADNGTSCGFVGYSGTSMATPAVAGSAVLARQYFAGGYYPSGQANPADGFSPTAALLKAMLIASADNMIADTTGSRPNNSQGWGRVHLDNALAFAGDPESLVVLDDRDATTGFTATGQQDTFQIFVADPSQPLKVVLVWTDPAAAPGASDALINDLDLEVELRGGIVYTGNANYANGWASPATQPVDHVNNQEAVMIAAPQAGNAAIRVGAFEINDITGHAQDYALIVVGGASSGSCSATAPPGMGDTLVVSKQGGALRLSWPDPGADHAHVHRSTSPSGFGAGTPVLADPVHDAAPSEPGIQWDDPTGITDAGSYYYVVRSANACHDEAP